MKKLVILSLVFLAIGVISISCKKSKDDAPTTGTLKGVITDNSNNQVLSNVRIIVFDANTNTPTDNSINNRNRRYL